ncbi:aquaporin [Truepera radiovictrix]|uniref:Major intrinsic protein n=1 Tax=Truepera radiovictrix (strain DSM 17093 / CIP 108686 / LMG 22925 / RQ-24) TaxID=649638 RepID=D7CSN4_TRURR|nr:aquaporin [Truepera radiovictrix]ADI15454.1 major intrinsic protein [Truepera radiovictrix DSM 17093]WMT55995.1 aquaporin [Truepera radiovictrix]
MLGTLQEDPKRFTRSLTAELVGTCLLLLAALFAPPNLTFVGVGLALMVLVAAIGKISGSHVNPAVTVSLMVARQIRIVDGLFYMVAQTLGAILAVAVARGLGHRVPPIEATGAVFWFELLGTFVLAFVVAQVVVKNVAEAGSALSIGGALALGVLIAGGASGGVLNPAFAVALTAAQVIERAFAAYLIAPLLAGVLGGALAAFLGQGDAPEAPDEGDEGESDAGRNVVVTGRGVSAPR